MYVHTVSSLLFKRVSGSHTRQHAGTVISFRRKDLKDSKSSVNQHFHKVDRVQSSTGCKPLSLWQNARKSVP